jgi:outer membrane protein
MKKVFLSTLLMLLISISASAQKYALIDMEYILKNIPAYERANEQLNQASKQWQSEVETSRKEAKAMYDNYQNESVFLSAEQKKKKENDIIAKETATNDLKVKYFGSEGELFKKRGSLIKPIQDEVYNAVKEISELRGYSMVIDRASANSVIYASPNIDISNEVLAKLGYSK